MNNMRGSFSMGLLFMLAHVSLYCQTQVIFSLDGLPTDSIEKVGIRGNLPPLSWDSSLPLERSGDNHSVSIQFEHASSKLEFKFVRYDIDADPSWEGIENRTLAVLPDTMLFSYNTWNKEQIVDIDALDPISSGALLKDFEFIRAMVLEAHPGTYRYNSKEEIESALSALRSSFSQSQTLGEAYLSISRLTARLKCDHTKAGFNNQNRTVNSVIHRQPNKLPFTFKWLEDKMVVTRNASESDQLEKGTIIHSINGISVKAIGEELLPYVGADGSTDGNRWYKLEVNGYDFRYNAFDIFYPLAFAVDSVLQIEIGDGQSSEREIIEIQLLTLDQRSKRLLDRYPNFPRTAADLWHFDVINDSTAVLTLNSFDLFGWRGMQLDYRKYLEEVFGHLNRDDISHLIIDIRENTGGNDEMATELFDYLTPDQFDFDREGRTRYLDFPETLMPFVQTWGDDPWYFNLNPKSKEPLNGYYIFEDNFTPRPRVNDKSIFAGTSYLLTSSANTSLAFYTAYRFKHQKLGLVIGQETGGNLNDVNGGQILFLRLPNSGIEIDFPIMGGFTIEPQANRGVIPNIEVEIALEELSEGRDLTMETVMDLIQN